METLPLNNNSCIDEQCFCSDPRSVEFVRGRSTNLALSTRGIEALTEAGVLESVCAYKFVKEYC